MRAAARFPPLRFFCALEAASLVLVLGASFVAIDEKDCSDATCKECTDNGVFHQPMPRNNRAWFVPDCELLNRRQEHD
jgi:hypothetical protein